MSFYIFRLEKIGIGQRRGKIPDNDVVTFGVMINQVDRGHGSGWFPVMNDGEVATTDDITEDGLLAYPATNRLNTSERWEVGPLEVGRADDVTIVYTGLNTSDSELDLGTQEQDEIEIKVLDIVAKKFVGLALGAGFGDDIGSALSEAFDKAFADPVGTLIGYKPQGPCNGPVFVGAKRFQGSDLDNLSMAPLTYTLYADTPYPRTVSSDYPGIRFTQTHTDEASHDPKLCGPIAVTDVTFSVLRVPFISLKTWVPVRFPHAVLSTGLGKLAQLTGSFSIKSLLGLRP